jgi:hypothetical protein
MPASELAIALSLNATSLYRHLHLLQECRLVVKTGAQVRNRRSEAIFAVPARRLLLEKAYMTEANAPALTRIVGALTRQLERDAVTGIKQGTGVAIGPQRTIGFSRRIGAPTAADLAAVNRRLAEISTILRRRHGKNGKLLAFGWVLAPVGRENRKKRAKT